MGYKVIRDNKMMKKSMFVVGAAAMLLLASCKSSPKAEERVSNVDEGLQDSVEAVMQRHLPEYGAMDGVAIVMETNSGRIKAMVGLESKGDGAYVRADSLAGAGHSSGLMMTVSMLAALDSDNVKPDTEVDTGNGIYVCDNKDTIRDHNWSRGGYGKLTLRQALAHNSNIGVVKAINEAFTDKRQFFGSVKKMSFGQPLEVEGLVISSCGQDANDMPWYYYAIGYGETSPIRMLAFYNAIANNGKMVAPLLYEPSHPTGEDVKAINPQIASPAGISDIREILEETVKDGLGRQAMPDKFTVAGMNGTISNEDGTLTADFCGYLPADNPAYTVLVSVHRKEIPASGGAMAGTIFKEIAELLYRYN